MSKEWEMQTLCNHDKHPAAAYYIILLSPPCVRPYFHSFLSDSSQLPPSFHAYILFCLLLHHPYIYFSLLLNHYNPPGGSGHALSLRIQCTQVIPSHLASNGTPQISAYRSGHALSLSIQWNTPDISIQVRSCPLT